MQTMKVIHASDVTWETLVHDEDIPVRGNVMVSGDEEADRVAEDAVIADLEAGNPWAWCSVEVRGTWRGLTASNWLGGCSYRDEEEFKASGYYEDMRGNVLYELNRMRAEICAE